MTDQELRERVLALVTDSPTMTFAELVNRLGARARGDRALYASRLDGSGPDPNAVLWMGTSLDLNEALIGLMHDGQIHLTPTPWLTYAYDGEVLQLPIAKRAPRHGFRAPHWVPAVLNPGPPR